ncbi:MAG: DUF5123 domain-containing protein, partial [Phocaeicola sp.]
KVALLLEKSGSYQEASGFTLPATIKSLMIVGKSGTVSPSVYLGGAMALASGIDLIHLYNVELHGVASSGYFINQSTTVAFGSIIVQSSVVHDLRGIARLRDKCSINSYQILNSVVYNIGNYNLVTVENESTAANIELSKSTFYNLSGRGIYLNSPTAPSTVVVDQCTFNAGPMYAVAQFNSTAKGTLTFTNNIMGLPYDSTRGVSAGSSAETTIASGNYYVSNTVWNGSAVGEDCGYAASALFANYSEGNFTQSKLQAGDPRWYK